MRPLAFCRFLPGAGWQPHVLSVDPASVVPPHPVDVQLGRKVPSEVRVDRVPHSNPLQTLLNWRNQIRSRIAAGSNASTLAGAAHAPTKGDGASEAAASVDAGTLADAKHLALDWAFAFPDPQCHWLKPALAAAKAWPRAAVPEVVYATGGPWTSLLVGQALASYWQVPFVADYRDPWSNNPYVSFRSELLNAKARKLETSVLQSADRIVANTPELQAQLAKDYPALAHKLVTITNGYDPESFSTTPQHHGIDKDAHGKGLEICHFGTVYGKRSPKVLLQTLLELQEAGRVSAERLRCRFVGAWDVDDAECERVAKQLEHAGMLRREPAIPYQACLQQMQAADVLLVMQPDSPLQIPGKIYEYVATRRPLLLIGGEGATANLVQRHRLGLASPNRPAELRTLLLDVAEGRRSLSTPDPEQVARFNYTQLTAQLAATLDDASRAKLQRAS